MIRRILLWITAFLPARIISDDGTPYLERYFVFQLFGTRCYLHRFVGSDPDRGLHDHPWRWAYSLVLAGWYLEQRRDGDRPVRWFNALTGDTFHRVVKPEGARDIWTLFLHSEADVKHWGFLHPHDNGAIALWQRYTYPGQKKDKRWELTAPRGRDLRR